MRLALKAQSQCRATLETLAQIKNPPVVLARQANIAQGRPSVSRRDRYCRRGFRGERWNPHGGQDEGYTLRPTGGAG
jgi:hypothetical protein